MIGKRDNMNKKGQALVEFILILPVLLLIAMAMIDIGNIFLNKYDLNKDLETVTELYQNNDTKNLGVYLANEELSLSEESKNGMIILTLKKNVKISAPILTNILGKSYEIKTTKTIYENYEGLNGE